jgi:hypothetical protein
MKGKKMIRINITKNNTRKTKSFLDKEEFIKYLKSDLSFHGVLKIANDVWNLNVAQKINFFGHTFSIQSKQRSGNILMNGK